jgi:hypothetical protein
MANVSTTDFGGAQAVSLSNDALELIAVTDRGPRVASLSLTDGENLLLWSPGEYTRDDWDLMGGHRVWTTTPRADECENTYAADNAPCEVEMLDDGFRLTGAENKTNRTRRGMEVRLVGKDRLVVDNFLTNTGDMLVAGGIWALTCTVPSQQTRYAVPLGDGSSWDAATVVLFREWAGHGQGGFADPQISFQDDLLLVDPRGVENKRAAQSHRGIIAMSDASRNVTFAKKMTYDPAGEYPMNCNIAFYIGPDNFMVEMETMGAERTLKPGQTLTHRETWLLREGAVDFTTGDALDELFA